jgi:hypothetical protein
MKNIFYSGEREKESPTIAPTIAPPVTKPRREDDPSRIPYKRPQVDPRPKA